VSAARKKARGLVALAVDERTPREERIAAALRAVKIIAKYDLLASPLDGILDNSNETVQAAKTIFDFVTDPKLSASVKTVADRFKRSRRR